MSATVPLKARWSAQGLLFQVPRCPGILDCCCPALLGSWNPGILELFHAGRGTVAAWADACWINML